MIRNLIFDFGKVLVDYDFDAFFRHYIPNEEKRNVFGKLLYTEEMMEAFDRELKPFEEIMDDVISANPQFSEELNIFKDKYSDIITGEMPGMYELLTRLKAKGYRLYGLTGKHGVH